MRYNRTEKTIKVNPDSVLAKYSAKTALFSCPFHWIEHRVNWNRTKALLGMTRIHGTYALRAVISKLLMSAIISGTVSTAQMSQRTVQNQTRLPEKEETSHFKGSSSHSDFYLPRIPYDQGLSLHTCPGDPKSQHSVQSGTLLLTLSRLSKKKLLKPTLISFCGFLISWKAVQHLQNNFPKEITVQAKFKYPIIDCMCFILSFHYNALSTIADRVFQSSSGSPKWFC